MLTGSYSTTPLGVDNRLVVCDDIDGVDGGGVFGSGGGCDPSLSSSSSSSFRSPDRGSSGFAPFSSG